MDSVFFSIILVSNTVTTSNLAEIIWSRFDLRYIQKCVVIESENLLIGFTFCVFRIVVHWMLRLRAYWIDTFILFCFIPISVLFFFSFVFSELKFQLFSMDIFVICFNWNGKNKVEWPVFYWKCFYHNGCFMHR